jgi:hypothetical protein
VGGVGINTKGVGGYGIVPREVKRSQIILKKSFPWSFKMEGGVTLLEGAKKG